MYLLLLIFFVAVGLIVVIAGYYNRAQELAQSVKENYANLAVTSKKRLELINILIDIARSYSDDEKLTPITVLNGSPAALAHATLRADSAVSHMNTLARKYPDLKSNDVFSQVTRDLNKIEPHLHDETALYNGAVKQYNTLCTRIPFLFVASSLGFTPASYFNIENTNSQGHFHETFLKSLILN